MRAPPTVGDRAMAIEGVTVAVISALICVATRHLALMSALVPLVLALRCVAWARLPVRERGGTSTGGGLKGEWFFLALCTALGAFNDWNSVVHHQIYDYTVPVA